MKILIPTAICVAVSLVVLGQSDPKEKEQIDHETPRIIGKIDTWKIKESESKKEQPRFIVNLETVKQKGDHRVVFQNVEKPRPLKIVRRANSRSENISSDDNPRDTRKNYSFTVSATVYDKRFTVLEMWSHASGHAERYEVVSNADWNLLEGFPTFEGRGKRFTFMLFKTNASFSDIENSEEVERLGKANRSLPVFRGRNSRYAVLKGDTKNEPIMDFLETIHELHEAKLPELKAASNARTKNRKIRRKRDEELKLNPPPKPDVKVSFWKKSK